LSGGLDDFPGLGFGGFTGGDSADLLALKDSATLGTILVDAASLILVGRAWLTQGGNPIFSP